jgi:aspartyl-tRNA(Asn)/glutamyl-tRNA(Gln) amidotransferase subunit C
MEVGIAVARSSIPGRAQSLLRRDRKQDRILARRAIVGKLFALTVLFAKVLLDMKVTEKDVSYVADLANLDLTEPERARMLRDLNSILEYVDRLNELDTSDIPPMAQVSDRYGVDESKQGSERFAYASREDIVEGLRKSLPHEEALANAHDADEHFFRVPKVIER